MRIVMRAIRKLGFRRSFRRDSNDTASSKSKTATIGIERKKSNKEKERYIEISYENMNLNPESPLYFTDLVFDILMECNDEDLERCTRVIQIRLMICLKL
jgi:hypothetical protein